jgi:hypothetical protein
MHIVSALLGHWDASITGRVYTHALPLDVRRHVDLLNAQKATGVQRGPAAQIRPPIPPRRGPFRIYFLIGAFVSSTQVV